MTYTKWAACESVGHFEVAQKCRSFCVGHLNRFFHVNMKKELDMKKSMVGMKQNIAGRGMESCKSSNASPTGGRKSDFGPVAANPN